MSLYYGTHISLGIVAGGLPCSPWKCQLWVVNCSTDQRTQESEEKEGAEHVGQSFGYVWLASRYFNIPWLRVLSTQISGSKQAIYRGMQIVLENFTASAEGLKRALADLIIESMLFRPWFPSSAMQRFTPGSEPDVEDPLKMLEAANTL